MCFPKLKLSEISKTKGADHRRKSATKISSGKKTKTAEQGRAPRPTDPILNMNPYHGDYYPRREPISPMPPGLSRPHINAPVHHEFHPAHLYSDNYHHQSFESNEYYSTPGGDHPRLLHLPREVDALREEVERHDHSIRATQLRMAREEGYKHGKAAARARARDRERERDARRVSRAGEDEPQPQTGRPEPRRDAVGGADRNETGGFERTRGEYYPLAAIGIRPLHYISDLSTAGATRGDSPSRYPGMPPLPYHPGGLCDPQVRRRVEDKLDDVTGLVHDLWIGQRERDVVGVRRRVRPGDGWERRRSRSRDRVGTGRRDVTQNVYLGGGGAHLGDGGDAGYRSGSRERLAKPFYRIV